MVDQYRYGRKKEHKVAQRLRNAGASVSLTPGSKGPEDMQTKFPGGKIWLVQSKATRSGSPSMPKPKDLGRLKQKATRENATPVVAQVDEQNRITFRSARDGRELKP